LQRILSRVTCLRALGARNDQQSSDAIHVVFEFWAKKANNRIPRDQLQVNREEVQITFSVPIVNKNTTVEHCMREKKTMMKKRKDSPVDEDSEDAEMEVLNAEEKVEVEDDDIESDDEMEKIEKDDGDDDVVEDTMEEERNPGVAVAEEENPFMDAFYGLSSSNPAERAQSANVVLHHSLIGPDANLKDSAYALRRLLNGLCSGRAASRQGNASALASFLKVALEGGQLEEIKSQDEKKDETESLLEYVRQRLLKATDPSSLQGKKKGSEERDYHFGRLFGILSIARSGILLPNDADNKSSYDVEEILSVTSGLVADLIELYWHKKWMREPAAHAIGTILNTFYVASADGATDTTSVAFRLIQELVVPRLLLDDSGNFSIEEYGPEQIALAASLQSRVDAHPDGLPYPLDKPILSTETIPTIAKTLAHTSSVTQPRMHLVWDAMWVFLTDSESDASPKSDGLRGPNVRTLVKNPAIGSNSTRDIIESIVRRVIVEGLLRADATEGSGKATHEQRALALCIIRNLLGVPFNSSITGPTIIQLQPEDFEIILTPVIIRRLFLDVICAGKAGSSRAHHLRPLAVQILEAVAEFVAKDVSDSGMQRRLAIAQCLLREEPRFDALTKTAICSELVGLSDAPLAEFGSSQANVLRKHFDSLEKQIISSASGERTELELQYQIDLLYQSAKRLLRVETSDDKPSDALSAFKSQSVQRTLGFLMASSFFDCKDLSPEEKTPSKKKKKKGKSDAAKHPVVEAGVRVKNLVEEGSATGRLPYFARSILSERFYSLLAEYVNASLHSQTGPVAKDLTMLGIITDICTGWKEIETAGAKPLFTAIDAGNGEAEGSESPEKVVSQLQSTAREIVSSTGTSEDAKANARKRCAIGCAVLASTLFLHLMGCGKPEDIMDEDIITTEDDDDSEDILDAIDGIGELMPLILDPTADNEQNPLAGFAEVCTGLFSSRLSSSLPGRGASPRLLREAVKFAWMGVLSASATSEKDALDNGVISVLLGSIGAIEGDMDGQMDAEDEEEGDSDDDESSVEELADFSKVGDILDGDDEEGNYDQEEKRPEPQTAEDEDEDVELSSDKLNSLLEEDSDAEVDSGELEHHEGADAALAMLIKTRQDARKEGRKARERLEIEKQLRSTLLLETLLGKSENWAGLLRSDIILRMAPPLLAYRNQIDKSLTQLSGKASSAEGTTKKAMLDRLTSILKTKLFKQKFASMSTSGDVDIVECCNDLAVTFLDMARAKASKDQRALCSVALVTVVKAAQGSDSGLEVASVYPSAVEEWSTKGTTRLETMLFDDLTHHCPR